MKTIKANDSKYRLMKDDYDKQYVLYCYCTEFGKWFRCEEDKSYYRIIDKLYVNVYGSNHPNKTEQFYFALKHKLVNKLYIKEMYNPPEREFLFGLTASQLKKALGVK